MKRGISAFFLFLIVFNSNNAFAVSNNASINYSISMPESHTHYFQVEIMLKNYKSDFVEFKMPVWTPGSYLVREYSKNVEFFQVFEADESKKIVHKKSSKNTWKIEHKGKDILVKYAVYANEGKIRMSYLDEDHAFIMANTVLMYVNDLKEKSSIVKLNIPKKWKHISTSLSEINGKPGSYYAPNYDILVDSPIEIGNHDIIEFTAAGVPHEIAMQGKNLIYDKNRIIRDVTKIVESSTAIFEENPNEKYVFIVHHSENGRGGLEHMSSTVLGMSRSAYQSAKGYRYFLDLVTHEYFHLWLVKRIKPVEHVEFDYENEIYTDLLWVMEGITSYYDRKITHRCGFYSDEEFIKNLLTGMAKERNMPGAKVQSLAEASFDAWVKFYRKSDNSINTQVSYYSKGEIIGALLDLSIINATNGEKSLDDVLNHIYYHNYKKKDKGITGADFKKVVEKISGKDMDGFFEDYIYGTALLNNEKFLRYAGIEVVETNNTTAKKRIGISTKEEHGKIVVSSIIAGEAAYEAGINVGDEIVAIDNLRISKADFSEMYSRYKIGDKIVMLLSRDGIVLTKEVEMRKDNTVSYTYEIAKTKTKQQEIVYSKWLDI